MPILALPACGPGANDGAPVPETDPAFSSLEADEALTRLEDRLLVSQDLEIRYRITSEGAFAAELEGAMRLAGGHELFLTGDGTFGGSPVALDLAASAGWMKGGNRSGNQDDGFEGPAPASLREAVVVGLTRMGLLHNLARLVAGAPPDRADGTVQEWVQARDVDWADPEEGEAGTRGIRFHISVAGQPAGEATLWLDERGLPVLREQVVRFPEGEMLVTERYAIG